MHNILYNFVHKEIFSSSSLPSMTEIVGIFSGLPGNQSP